MLNQTVNEKKTTYFNSMFSDDRAGIDKAIYDVRKDLVVHLIKESVTWDFQDSYFRVILTVWD